MWYWLFPAICFSLDQVVSLTHPLQQLEVQVRGIANQWEAFTEHVPRQVDMKGVPRKGRTPQAQFAALLSISSHMLATDTLSQTSEPLAAPSPITIELSPEDKVQISLPPSSYLAILQKHPPSKPWSTLPLLPTSSSQALDDHQLAALALVLAPATTTTNATTTTTTNGTSHSSNNNLTAIMKASVALEDLLSSRAPVESPETIAHALLKVLNGFGPLKNTSTDSAMGTSSNSSANESLSSSNSSANESLSSSISSSIPSTAFPSVPASPSISVSPSSVSFSDPSSVPSISLTTKNPNSSFSPSSSSHPPTPPPSLLSSLKQMSVSDWSQYLHSPSPSSSSSSSFLEFETINSEDHYLTLAALLSSNAFTQHSPSKQQLDLLLPFHTALSKHGPSSSSSSSSSSPKAGGHEIDMEPLTRLQGGPRALANLMQPSHKAVTKWLIEWANWTHTPLPPHVSKGTNEALRKHFAPKQDQPYRTSSKTPPSQRRTPNTASRSSKRAEIKRDRETQYAIQPEISTLLQQQQNVLQTSSLESKSNRVFSSPPHKSSSSSSSSPSSSPSFPSSPSPSPSPTTKFSELLFLYETILGRPIPSMHKEPNQDTTDDPYSQDESESHTSSPSELQKMLLVMSHAVMTVNHLAHNHIAASTSSPKVPDLLTWMQQGIGGVRNSLMNSLSSLANLQQQVSSAYGPQPKPSKLSFFDSFIPTSSSSPVSSSHLKRPLSSTAATTATTTSTSYAHPPIFLEQTSHLEHGSLDPVITPIDYVSQNPPFSLPPDPPPPDTPLVYTSPETAKRWCVWSVVESRCRIDCPGGACISDASFCPTKVSPQPPIVLPSQLGVTDGCMQETTCATCANGSPCESFKTLSKCELHTPCKWDVTNKICDACQGFKQITSCNMQSPCEWKNEQCLRKCILWPTRQICESHPPCAYDGKKNICQSCFSYPSQTECDAHPPCYWVQTQNQINGQGFGRCLVRVAGGDPFALGPEDLKPKLPPSLPEDSPMLKGWENVMLAGATMDGKSMPSAELFPMQSCQFQALIFLFINILVPLIQILMLMVMIAVILCDILSNLLMVVTLAWLISVMVGEPIAISITSSIKASVEAVQIPVCLVMLPMIQLAVMIVIQILTLVIQIMDIIFMIAFILRNIGMPDLGLPMFPKLAFDFPLLPFPLNILIPQLRLAIPKFLLKFNLPQLILDLKMFFSIELPKIVFKFKMCVLGYNPQLNVKFGPKATSSTSEGSSSQGEAGESGQNGASGSGDATNGGGVSPNPSPNASPNSSPGTKASGDVSSATGTGSSSASPQLSNLGIPSSFVPQTEEQLLAAQYVSRLIYLDPTPLLRNQSAPGSMQRRSASLAPGSGGKRDQSSGSFGATGSGGNTGGSSNSDGGSGTGGSGGSGGRGDGTGGSDATGENGSHVTEAGAPPTLEKACKACSAGLMNLQFGFNLKLKFPQPLVFPTLQLPGFPPLPGITLGMLLNVLLAPLGIPLPPLPVMDILPLKLSQWLIPGLPILPPIGLALPGLLNMIVQILLNLELDILLPLLLINIPGLTLPHLSLALLLRILLPAFTLPIVPMPILSFSPPTPPTIVIQVPMPPIPDFLLMMPPLPPINLGMPAFPITLPTIELPLPKLPMTPIPATPIEVGGGITLELPAIKLPQLQLPPIPSFWLDLPKLLLKTPCLPPKPN